MANELKHGSVGTELTQAEWEGIGAHVFANQAEGDIMYASSTSQLRRLAKGTDTHVLTLASGVPAWSATTGITTVGTIATGVWQGTDVGVAYGGTGVSTHTQNGVLVGNGASAIGSIDMSTKGHVLIGDGSGNPQMLGVGTNNHVMTADSGETTGVKWAAPAAAAAGSLTGSTLASGVVTTSATTVGVLNSGSINTGFGNIDNGSSTLDTGAATVASLDVSNGSLLNVGSSGSDWTATGITVEGTSNSTIQRSNTATGSNVTTMRIKADTSNDMADGYGPQLVWTIRDSADVNNDIGYLVFQRAGADNTSDFVLATRITGSANEAFKVSSTGVGSFDLAGDGNGAPSLFDRYDDATELQRFAYSGEGVEDVVSGVTEEQRLANRERMVEMGILEAVPGASSGYHMRIQPLMRLLAGGIYQNRHRMDSQYEELSRRLEAIGA